MVCVNQLECLAEAQVWPPGDRKPQLFKIALIVEHSPKQIAHGFPCFPLEVVPEFCVVFLEKHGAVLRSGRVLGSEWQHCVVELAEGNSPQIFAVNSLHEHKHVLIAELAKLKVVSETIRQVLNRNTAQIVGVKEVESVLQIEVVLQGQVDSEGLQVLANEDDLLEHTG